MTMIKFNLNREFKRVQEGIRTLEITECTATPSGYPTEMRWTMRDVEDGATLQDRCNITEKSTNIWKISRIASVILNVNDGDSMDAVQLANSLIGKKVQCEIVHNQGTTAREDGTFPIYVNIKNVISAVEDAPIESMIPNTMIQSATPRNSIINNTLSDL